MTLSSLVVSRDWQEVSVLECILGSLQMDVAVEKAPERALARLNRNKIDALIVDCDLDGTAQFLRELRRERRHPNTVPLVIMGSRHRKKDLEATGALFAFDKPISVEQAVHTLSAARNMILDGRLRYHRAGLEVPVALSCNPGKRVEVQLINLSQGGLQVYSDELFETSKPLQVSFELPGSKHAMRAQAQVAWRDGRGNLGIRFLKVAPRLQRVLQLWLAQQYFAN
jgi:CheY-like chemotaxis protein